jgi:glutamate 5-kinase
LFKNQEYTAMNNYLYVKNAEKARRVIIKIGSSSLTHPTGKLNIKRIESLTKVIADFSNAGREIILVSSGAVSAGRQMAELARARHGAGVAR